MEEKKTIKVGLSTLAIIVIIMLVAIMACVILTMNLLKTSLTDEVSSIKESVYDFYSADKRYEQYITTYSQRLKNVLEGKSEIRISLSGDRQYELPGISSVYLNSQNEAYVSIEKNSNLYETYGENFHIGNKIANIYVAQSGNGGYSYIYLIKFDGTVDCINGIEVEKGNLEVTTVDGLKNIVNVIECSMSSDNQSGSKEPIFIDIEGNIYRITDHGAQLY